MSLPPTVSALELLWTILALPGLGLSVYNIHGALSDLRYHWTDGLRGVGWIGLVKVSIVLAMALLVIGSGAIAMTVPEPIRPEVQDASDLVAVCLLFLDLTILALAVVFFIERRYVVPHVHMHTEAP
jgi:hypothetical protein